MEFGVTARLLLRTSVSIQDIHANILNLKQGFCNIGPVWFHSKNFIGFNASLTYKHFEFERRFLLANFGVAVRLFFGNLFSMQDFHSNIL